MQANGLKERDDLLKNAIVRRGRGQLDDHSGKHNHGTNHGHNVSEVFGNPVHVLNVRPTGTQSTTIGCFADI